MIHINLKKAFWQPGTGHRLVSLTGEAVFVIVAGGQTPVKADVPG
jgi:hypothetical protein